MFLDRWGSGGKRQVPLSTVALKALKPWVASRKMGRLFPWWSGNQDVRELQRSRRCCRVSSPTSYRRPVAP